MSCQHVIKVGERVVTSQFQCYESYDLPIMLLNFALCVWELRTDVVGQLVAVQPVGSCSIIRIIQCVKDSRGWYLCTVQLWRSTFTKGILSLSRVSGLVQAQQDLLNSIGSCCRSPSSWWPRAAVHYETWVIYAARLGQTDRKRAQ